MGQDKASLRYEQRRQIERAFQLLSRFCERVFVSIREDQREISLYESFPYLIDRHKGIGPISGIAAAFDAYPKSAWLVMAIDLPLADSRLLIRLVENRCSDKAAIAFSRDRSRHGKKVVFIEPLCTIYEPLILPLLRKGIDSHEYSIRGLMLQTDIRLIHLSDRADLTKLTNVNDRESYTKIIRHKNPIKIP